MIKKLKSKKNSQLIFTIILTTYNSKNYINKTLKSIFAQKFDNFQLIIVDDGSTDNTLKIIKNLKKKNKYNLKILKLSHRGSPARSRNEGIKKSKGKYICFLDCDDTFHRNKLNYLYNLIKINNFDIFYHNVYLKHEKKNLYCKIINKKSPFEDLIFGGNKIVLSSSCIKKTFLLKTKIKFNENKNFFSVEDYDFWLKIAKHKGRFFLITKILGTYNLNKHSISRKRIVHFLNTIYLLKTHEKFLKNRKFQVIIRKLRIVISFIKISFLEKNFDFLLFVLKFLISLKFLK